MGETGDDMQALAHPLVAYLGFYDKVWGSVEKCGKWKARVDSACRLGLGFRFRFYPMHRPPLPPSPSPPPPFTPQGAHRDTQLAVLGSCLAMSSVDRLLARDPAAAAAAGARGSTAPRYCSWDVLAVVQVWGGRGREGRGHGVGGVKGACVPV